MALKLKEVRGVLFDCRKKWKFIGEELEIEDSVLDEIKKRNEKSDDAQLNSLTDMIKEWLKLLDPEPTWEQLATALRAKAVKEEITAKEVESKISTSSGSNTQSASGESGNQSQARPSNEASSLEDSAVSTEQCKDETQTVAAAISKDLIDSTEVASLTKGPDDAIMKSDKTSTRYKPRKCPCLLERRSDGTYAFESAETGEKFLNPSEFMEYNDQKRFKKYEGETTEISTLPSFHGVMGGDEAERCLREQESDCCYLTRYSENRDELTLSVLNRKFENFAIVGEPQECPTAYEITGSDRKFDHIADLLEFYKNHPLDHSINSIGDEVPREHENGAEQESPHSSPIYKKTFSRVANAVPQWALQAMDRHSSFHGSMTRIEAAKKLIEQGTSCYLTRYSEYRNKFCVLSALQMSGDGELLLHFKLEIPRHEDDERKYKVAGTDITFDSISGLLDHYQNHSLKTIDRLGQCLEADRSLDLNTEFEFAAIEEQEEASADLSRPTKSNLHCITYQDEDGESHDFKLLEQVSDGWKKAGMRLNLNKKTLDKYYDKAEDDIKCCEYVFFKWIKNRGHQDYPLSWVGLHKLLVDMGKRTAAEKLYKVLQTSNDNTVY